MGWGEGRGVDVAGMWRGEWGGGMGRRDVGMGRVEEGGRRGMWRGEWGEGMGRGEGVDLVGIVWMEWGE